MASRLEQTGLHGFPAPREDEFRMLRHLVLGEEQQSLRLMRDQIRYLEGVVRGQEELFSARLDSHATKLQQEMGPAAFQWLKSQAASPEQYEEVGRLMSLPLEAGLRSSASENREGLARVLAPVLGPGIRASVAEFFRHFVEQLDSLLRSANLPQRLWWRIQAARRGVPYSEFVLRKTARYAVLLVQLVEKSSGQVLCEVRSQNAPDQPAEFTSQSLLANALLRQPLPEWESIRLSGQRLSMQLRVLGGGGDTMRSRASSILAACEQLLGDDQLDELNSTQVENLRDAIEPLVCAQPERHRSPWLGIVLVLTLLAGLVYWLLSSWQRQHRQALLLNALRETPGIVVTGVDQSGGQWIVRGLRDPLAPDPRSVVARQLDDVKGVEFDFAPYHSVGTNFETLRQMQLEQKEAEAAKVLWSRGEEQRSMIEDLTNRQEASIKARLAAVLGGSVPDSMTLRWDSGTLVGEGSLPESQLIALNEEAKRLELLVPVNTTRVVPMATNPSLEQLIEAMDIPFVTGTIQMETTAESMIEQLVEQMRKLDVHSPREQNYRLRAWPITGEQQAGNLGMQLQRLSLVRAQMQALGYPVRRIGPGVAESESLSGRRGVWVEVMPESKSPASEP